MTNLDVWLIENASAGTGDCSNWSNVQFVSLGNIFGGTVQLDGTSITDVKKKFREEE